MTAPDALVRLLEPWSQLYGDSNWISTLVVFGHIAALVFAGGLATTYFSSGIYWVKMALVVALLVNGYVMTRTERRIRGLTEPAEAWARLRFTALASLVLWFTIALAGVALVNLS
jgi:hypothetical protein